MKRDKKNPGPKKRKRKEKATIWTFLSSKFFYETTHSSAFPSRSSVDSTLTNACFSLTRMGENIDSFKRIVKGQLTSGSPIVCFSSFRHTPRMILSQFSNRYTINSWILFSHSLSYIIYIGQLLHIHSTNIHWTLTF